MRPNRALLIVNPHSRNGGASIASAIACLEARGIALLRASCEASEASDLAGLIVDRSRDVDSVIVAGGDGTLNAAATGLIRTALPLGVLPTGTANDLARTLGIPTDIAQAAAVIAAGRARRIDLGEVNGRPFFNVASIGLARRLSPEAKRRFGRLAYPFAALRVLLTARPFRATIAGPDGEAHVRSLQIAVGNGRYYGGGMAVERSARIDDHRLDLYSLELRRAWKLALMLPWFHKGGHGVWPEVRTARAASFEIRTRHPMPVNTDGELVTMTPARFSVLPRAVTVFAPPPDSPTCSR